MVWRSITIIFVHITIALLVWSGYAWIVEGEGMNPLIAFPSAFILYVAHMLWIQSMCDEHEVYTQALLEYIQVLEENLNK